jgi:selenoprotein W-related protein
MVQAILDKFEHYIESITVIPSRGGVFEVTVGDDLVFSKKELGRHATVDEVIESIDAIVGPVPVTPEG